MEDINEQIKIKQEQIARVIFDIDHFRQNGRADKKVETLEFYKEYLEDELKDLRRKQDASKS
jgi:hypothetical protein